MMTNKLAVVFGGSGFVGRNVVRELAKRGWRVRVAVRRPHLALFLRTMGHVGQIQLAQANIRYRDSVAEAVKGADAVVNLVGILNSGGSQNSRAVHSSGAGAIADLATKAGASRFIHVSAIGADPESESAYQRTKGEGERAVRDAFPAATILRPSVVFGPEDTFFNKFASMLSLVPPFVPVPLLIGGGKTKFQPVYVDDVADAVCEALARPDAAGKIYELGGPRTYTFRELMELMLRETGRSRILAPVPFALAPIMGFLGGLAGLLPFIDPPVTVDQVKQLKHDNVVGEGALTIRDLGVTPAAVESVLPGYMVRFRKYGQFAEQIAQS